MGWCPPGDWGVENRAAAEVLTEAGTFGVDGAWVCTDVDGEPHPPPYFDPDPDDSEESRDVEFPGKLRQVTDSAIGYDAETVISAQPGGPAMWQRFPAYSGQLERRQEDARRVLETVVPFDPSAEPQPIEGLG